MSHQRQGVCTKQHQNPSIVNCLVRMLSIRAYTELLKILFTSNHTAWSGPRLVWYMVKTANFPAVVARQCSIPIWVADMERPSAHNHLKNSCDWDQGSQTWVSITKPSPVKHKILSPWLMSVSAAVDSQYSFAAYRETIEAIFFAIMFSLLLFCGKSLFHSSPHLRTCSLVDWSRFFFK